jgi:hypothetical protein
MSIEWQGGAPVLPRRPRLTPEQQDAIKANLWSLGITENPFTMDPVKRREFLSRKSVAVAVYAAIKHESRGEYELTQTFTEWWREVTG